MKNFVIPGLILLGVVAICCILLSISDKISVISDKIDIIIDYDHPEGENVLIEFKSILDENVSIDSVEITIDSDTRLSNDEGQITYRRADVTNKILVVRADGYEMLTMELGNANYLQKLIVFMEPDATPDHNSAQKTVHVRTYLDENLSNFTFSEIGSTPSSPTVKTFSGRDSEGIWFNLLTRNHSELTFGSTNTFKLNLRVIKDSARIEVMLDNSMDMMAPPPGGSEPATDGGS